MSQLKSICFYLPQFHPIAENDEWWGKGFTEWRNVARAGPRFKGHYQPHIPADLGFYDLRAQETRVQQAELARRYGIQGFCYYHYWFNGQRLLERPVDDLIASGEPDFPFMLCWANENWTRRWDGADQEILMRQDYGDEDDRRHLRHLAGYFADPRYIRVDGKPVFLVYKAFDMADPKRTTDVWRQEASRLGLGELFLCRVESHGPDRGDPRPLGFDAAVEFAPDVNVFPARIDLPKWGRAARRVLRPRSGYRFNHVYSYDELVERSLGKPAAAYPRYRCVTPSWDNSARRAQWATIFRDASPETFERWTYAMALESERNGSEFLFVNAWNEWAEGNHLEPDLRFGHAYLRAHQSARRRARAALELPGR